MDAPLEAINAKVTYATTPPTPPSLVAANRTPLRMRGVDLVVLHPMHLIRLTETLDDEETPVVKSFRVQFIIAWDFPLHIAHARIVYFRLGSVVRRLPLNGFEDHRPHKYWRRSSTLTRE